MGTSIIKNKRISDAKIIMIKDEFKIVRNKKVNPQTDKIKVESEDDELILSFGSEGEAVVLRDFKVIVEDVGENERTANENVNDYRMKKLNK